MFGCWMSQTFRFILVLWKDAVIPLKKTKKKKNGICLFPLCFIYFRGRDEINLGTFK